MEIISWPKKPTVLLPPFSTDMTKELKLSRLVPKFEMKTTTGQTGQRTTGMNTCTD